MAEADSARGILYLCPTPIGNMKDITLRTLECLQEADLIAAEDTRQARKLLSYHGMRKPMLSYRAHNRQKQGKVLIERLQRGARIALVTDAGMPGISDPGTELVERAVEAGIEVVGLPGPSAAITALVVSTLPASRFVFYGFLSRQKKQRRQELAELSCESKTVILYEAPHRLTETLEELVHAAGGKRPAAVVRELTKKFEEVRRGTLAEHLDYFRRQPPRGEITVVLAGKEEVREPTGGEEIKKNLLALLEGGVEPKQAVKAVSVLRSVPKNKVYQVMISIKGEKNKQG